MTGEDKSRGKRRGDDFVLDGFNDDLKGTSSLKNLTINSPISQTYCTVLAQHVHPGSVCTQGLVRFSPGSHVMSQDRTFEFPCFCSRPEQTDETLALDRDLHVLQPL